MLDQTQKFSQKWTIVALLDDTQPGYEFNMKNWPRHVTMMPVFAVDLDSVGLTQVVEKVASEFRSVDGKIASHVQWGKDGQLQVALLEANKSLQSMHDALCNQLAKSNLLFNEPNYAYANFKPHVTKYQDKVLSIGDTVRITNLCVVDMFPNDEPFERRIVSRIELVH